MFRTPALIMILISGAMFSYALYFLHAAAVGPVIQGNVEVRTVNLGFKVAGRIAKIEVDEGDAVGKGQILASLDKSYFKVPLLRARAQRDQKAANYEKLRHGNRVEEIAQAKALVAEREAILTNARLALNRAQALLETSAGSRRTLDDAKAIELQADAQLSFARHALLLQEAGFRDEDIKIMKAELEESQVVVKIAERNLVDADLIAPTVGTIQSRIREAGSIVAAGEAVFVLTLSSPVWVKAYVSESDLERVPPGKEVQIKTDTPGAKPLTARIASLSNTAEFTPKNAATTELRTSLSYQVRILAEDHDGLLRQGMPVTVIIEPQATH